jgi:CheY-like chemotaxis protein
MQCLPEIGRSPRQSPGSKGIKRQNHMANCGGNTVYATVAQDHPHSMERRSSRQQASDEESAMVERALVSVVDDDESVRESLPDLLKEFGFAVQAFSSAEAFLASDSLDKTRCLILDVTMPGMSGPDLQRELINRQKNIPIVFITAHRAEAVRPNILGQGAVACLLKPFSDTALFDAINTALRRT